MKDPRRFYTYAYLREDRTPYYVGKGSGKRIYDKNGRPCGKPKDSHRIIFLKQNLTEEEAFKHEIYMISLFGRKDLGTGMLYNRTNGGDGSSGVITSEETRKKRSELSRGKNNPFYGKKHSEEANRKQSEARKGKKHHFYGKKHSEETKRKQSEAKRGKKHSEETKQRWSEKRKGKKWWNNGFGDSTLAKECPGEGWKPGRK